MKIIRCKETLASEIKELCKLSFELFRSDAFSSLLVFTVLVAIVLRRGNYRNHHIVRFGTRFEGFVAIHGLRTRKTVRK